MRYLIGRRTDYGFFAWLCDDLGVIYRANFNTYPELKLFLDYHKEPIIDVHYASWGDTLLMKLIRS